MEFTFEKPDKFWQVRPKPGNADGSNSLLPGILVISSHRENLIEQHLRREVCALCREFRATIAAQDSASHDRGGQRANRDARKEGRLVVVKQGDGSKRRAHHYARI